MVIMIFKCGYYSLKYFWYIILYFYFVDEKNGNVERLVDLIKITYLISGYIIVFFVGFFFI